MHCNLLRALTLALAVFTILFRGNADTLEWTDPIDGDFSDATKWTVTSGAGGPPPAAGDLIFLNEAGDYTITLTQNEASDFLRATTGAVSLLSDAATPRTLDLTTGGADLSVRGGGTLNLGSATNPVIVNVGDRLEVAHGSGGGAGTVNVAGAATELNVLGVTTHNFGISGQVAVVNVTDDASLNFVAGSTLAIGRSGTGSSDGRFAISGGGDLVAGNLDIATLTSTAFGSLSVSGAGSTATQIGTSTLNLGSDTGGQGVLAIDDQAVFFSDESNVNPTGLVMVESGGTWNVGGQLTIADGGEVFLEDGMIHANAGLDNSSGGTLTLDAGALNVTGGVFLPNNGADFEIDSGHHLTLGSGATANIAGSFGVTDSESAKVSIVDGAQVVSTSGLVLGGPLPVPGPIATLALDGVGSQWTVDGPITFGSREFDSVALAGQLLVTGGAVVTSDSGTFGKTSFGQLDNPNTPAIASVAGAGSRWSNSGALTTGIRQLSIVEVSDQAVVQAGSVDIGPQTRFTIDGPGARLEVSGSLVAQTITRDVSDSAGNVVTQEFSIRNGAALTAGQAVLGVRRFDLDSPPSVSNAITSPDNGAVVVSGPGSLFSVSGLLVLGTDDDRPGDANLHVTDGGRLATGSAWIGGLGASLFLPDQSEFRRVIVSDPGSEWINAGGLALGGDFVTAAGLGEVILQKGGRIDVGGALTVWEAGKVTIDDATLKLDSSQATVDGTVTFNSGTLILTDTAGYSVGSGVAFVEELIGDTEVVLSQGKSLVVENTLAVPTGGSITQVGGELEAATLANSGLVNVNGTTVTTTAGLENDAQLVLINATVDGPVDNAAGAAITVLGSVDFNGPVTGAGGFFGPGLANFSSTLSLGSSPAEVAFEGSVALSETSELIVELAGTAVGEFDRIVVGGDLTLSGDLRVELLDGFAPELGDAFEIAAVTGETTGGFAAELLPGLGPLLTLQLLQTDDAAWLVVTPALPGDYNADGAVDVADYTVWRDSLGVVGTGLAADGDLNGVIDVEDYNVWRNNFGATASFTESRTMVPEPAAGLLALIAFACYPRRHRR